MKNEIILKENKNDLDLLKKLADIKTNFNHKIILIDDFISNKSISNENKLFVIRINIEELVELINMILDTLSYGDQDSKTQKEVAYFTNKKQLVENILDKIKAKDFTAINDFKLLID